jgi:hypothetical protein
LDVDSVVDLVEKTDNLLAGWKVVGKVAWKVDMTVSETVALLAVQLASKKVV